MFGFDRPEDGSKERFDDRVKHWEWLGREMAPLVGSPRGIEPDPTVAPVYSFVMKCVHHGWWIIHNCVTHPLIGIAPIRLFFRFHDWTSRKMNGE